MLLRVYNCEFHFPGESEKKCCCWKTWSQRLHKFCELELIIVATVEKGSSPSWSRVLGVASTMRKETSGGKNYRERAYTAKHRN